MQQSLLKGFYLQDLLIEPTSGRVSVAGEDLAALGFHLDVLKIQNVSDERGYLEAIGRKKAAEAVHRPPASSGGVTSVKLPVPSLT